VTGAEFWVWAIAVALTVTVGVRFFLAAWRDHDDDLSAIGSHRWHIDEVDR
jgi:hypothetical protein